MNNNTRGSHAAHLRWLLPVIVLVLGAGAFVGLTAARTPPPPKPEEKKLPLVEVRAAHLQPLQLVVRSQGLVKPRFETQLIAQVSGEVVRVADAFVRGGVVRKNDLLAEIDPTNYEVRVEEARAALASAHAALELEVAQGEVAKSEWQKVQGRVAPALGLRQPQLAQAQAQVTAAQAALKQAQKDLERTRIKAPYDALITERAISPGTYVSAGSLLGQVSDVTTAEIRLPINSGELAYLDNSGVDAPVTLQLASANATDHWPATIVRAEGVVDENTRMIYLVAQLDDPYRKRLALPGDEPVLPFGSYVTAAIEGLRLESALRIPRHLIKEGQLAVAEEGLLRFKPVQVLRHEEGLSTVTAGLVEGDLVITTALDFPVEGMALEVKGHEEPVAPVESLAETPKAFEGHL